MAILQFSKMHALGNDFMVVDSLTNPFTLSGTQIAALGHRRFGVGFDQLLLVAPYYREDADFLYRIFNNDGMEVGQCGNGARAVARYLIEKGEATGDTVRLKTHDGVMVTVCKGEAIAVDMGQPFAHDIQRQLRTEPLQYDYVDVGNPHGIIWQDDIDHNPHLKQFATRLTEDPFFPEGVNVSIAHCLDKQRIAMRVYERGVGETMACGSAACAAVVAGRLRGWLDDTVSVQLPGGPLTIEWAGVGASLRQTGPAVKVFEGQVDVL